MTKLPMLPPMRCDNGCGDCCGIVPASPTEYRAVIAYAKKNKITPMRLGITCPFYQGGTCTVYEVRPTICKTFGHVPDMACSRGYNTNVDPEIIDEMIRRSGDIANAQLLHHALVDAGLATIEDMLSPIPSVLRSIAP